MASSTSSSSDIVTDLSPFIRVYKDGKVERLLGSPFVPACPEDPATGVSSKDINISPQVSARLYLPKAESIESSEKLPILIYCHGGGFCLDSAFDFLCHRYVNLLVSQAKAVAISVDYRLAPEFPLPAAYEDSWTALTWVASHSVSDIDIGGDKEPWLLNHGNFDKIYLVGDSCGGNIVHNLAIKAGGESLPGDVKIAGGIISHPFFWGSKFESSRKAETTSSDQQHHNHNNTERSYYYRLWLFAYPSAPGGIDNPMVNPFPLLSAGEESDDAAPPPPPRLSGIGCRKLLVCTSEKDDIRETSVLYVDALKKSGWKGEVEFVDIEGEGHCFQIFKPETENAKNFINRMASFINGQSSNDIVTDLSPYIRVHRDGTVERLFSSPFVPPSLNTENGGVSSKDIKISSEVSARLYLPLTDDDEKLPILVYYHAGGFCLESAFSFLDHRYLNLLVSQGKCIAVSVEYRLAPENPLPAAFQDSWTALQWVTSHHHHPAAGVGDPWLLKHGDFNKLYLGGDSAGGTIVHYLAMRAGVDSLPADVKITGGFLSHPYFWGSKSEQQLFNKKSGGGGGIGEAGVGETSSNPYKMWMLAYPSVPGGIDNPLINPIAEDAPSLLGMTCSRLLVVVAEKDELREAGLMYVDALKKSGWKGDVDLVDEDGEDHCFHLLNADTEKSKNLIRRIASFIRN